MPKTIKDLNADVAAEGDAFFGDTTSEHKATFGTITLPGAFVGWATCDGASFVTAKFDTYSEAALERARLAREAKWHLKRFDGETKLSR